MPLILRYIARALLGPLALWVAFLFLLLFVMQFLRGTDVLLGSSVTLLDYGRLVLDLTPHFLVMSLPIGLLLAILLGLGRLAEDRELLALQALGNSPWQMAAVPLVLGALLGVTVLALATTLEPWGLNQVKLAVSEIVKRNVLGDVRAGVFYEDLSDLTLYAQHVDKKAGLWTNVLVHDERDPRAPLLVLAHRGTVDPAGAGTSLTVDLRNGEVHRAEVAGGDYAVLNFERCDLAVGVEDALVRKNRFRSPKEELTPVELLGAAREARKRGRDAQPFLTAYHVRLAEGLTPLAFALLAVPLALAGRKSRGTSVLLTLLAYVLYYVVERAFENLGNAGRLPPLLAGQAPNAIFGLLGALLWSRLRGRRLAL